MEDEASEDKVGSGTETVRGLSVSWVATRVLGARWPGPGRPRHRAAHHPSGHCRLPLGPSRGDRGGERGPPGPPTGAPPAAWRTDELNLGRLPGRQDAASAHGTWTWDLTRCRFNGSGRGEEKR